MKRNASDIVKITQVYNFWNSENLYFYKIWMQCENRNWYKSLL